LRLTRPALLLWLVALAAPTVRAEYVVLRNGQRLRVTSYELLGDTYKLQMKGGSVTVPVDDVVSIEPEDTFGPTAAKPVAAPPYRELVEAAAAKYKVDADLVTSVIAVESNFDPKAVSRKNARGLMQLLPETAMRFGVQNIDDPQENIEAGTQYLKELLERYNNNLALTLAAYNAGPEKVQLYGGNVPPFRETISYVRRVKRGYEKSKTQAASKPEPAVALAPVTKPVEQKNPVPLGNGTPPAPSALTSPANRASPFQ